MPPDSNTTEAVTQIEGLIGRPLPQDYRRWLLDPDAPSPIPSEVLIPDTITWIDQVQALYCAEQVLHDFQAEAEGIASGFRNLPKQTLPIGDNGLGDDYLVSLREGDFGSVYYLFHETAAPEEDDWAGIYVLSPNFKDWLATLKQIEPKTPMPDWEAIWQTQRDQIICAPRKPWWRFW